MNEETKKVFSPRPVVSLRSPRKRTKLYPLDRLVGSMKCSKERCGVCVNVSETKKFASNVTGKIYKINHKLKGDESCVIYLWSCVVENSMLGKQLAALGIDGITIGIMIESILVRRAVCKNIYLNILTTWDTMVSLTMFQ